MRNTKIIYKKNSKIGQLSNIDWLSNITNMVPIYYASLLIWLASNKQQLNLCKKSEKKTKSFYKDKAIEPAQRSQISEAKVKL